MDADAFAGRAAQSADDEGVWFWHPWAGAKFADLRRRPFGTDAPRSAGDGD